LDVVEYGLSEWTLTGAMLVAVVSVVGVAVALGRNWPRIALMLVFLFAVALAVGPVNALMGTD
jgi:hypothetical protein